MRYKIWMEVYAGGTTESISTSTNAALFPLIEIMKHTYLAAAALLGMATACPDHKGLWKRSGESNYDYQFPEDWVRRNLHIIQTIGVQQRFISIQGHLNKEYQLCSTGTQQTPLRLTTADGSSRYHKPSFEYPSRMNGYLENSGTSLSYTLSESDNTTNTPSFSFQESNDTNEEVYLIGW